MAACLVAGIAPALAADDAALRCEALYSAQRQQEALPVCRQAAEAGHCESQANLAWLLAWGPAPNDAPAGFAWMKRAAECGSGRARNNLGLMYGDGIGTAVSDEEAIRWLQRSVEQGETWAMRQLALHYTQGRGVAKSEETARQLRLRAAELGDVDAYMLLAEEAGWMQGQEGMVWLQGYRKFNRPFWRVWRVGSGRASAALGTDRAQIGGSCVGFRHRGATQRLSA